MSQYTRSVLVADVDNTLFDWFEVWHASFSAMLDRLEEKSGVEREELLTEIREVHQRTGTSEYAFLIEALPCLKGAAGSTNLLEFYEDAVSAYRTERDRTLRLYQGVERFLASLRRQGVTIVCYTESLAYYTNYRFRKLRLDRLVDYLYSPADHDLPAGLSVDEIRKYPASHYQFALTQHRYTPANEFKPNPDILMSIIEEIGAEPSDAVYVGDSLMKDVAMAQKAGVLDVHAAYGAIQNPTNYELLRAVTHWTDDDVERERRINASGPVIPTFVLRTTLSELGDLVSFGRKEERISG